MSHTMIAGLQGQPLLRRWCCTRSSSSTSGTWVISGGRGFVGCQLRRRLRAVPVVIVSRTSKSDSLRTNNERFVSYEHLEKVGLPEDTVAIVNAAGHNLLDPLRRWNDSFKKLVYDSRVGPCDQLLASLDRHPPQRPPVFIQLTGVSAYPSDNGLKLYDEYSDINEKKKEDSVLDRLVFDLEKRAFNSVDQGLCSRAISIRAGVVLGRQGGLVERLILPFWLGLGGVMGSGSQPMAWIHVDDLADAICHIVNNQSVEGIVNGVAPHTITNREFVSSFAAALRRPAFIPVPEFVWKLIFGEERANLIIKGQKVLPKKLEEAGFTFKYGQIDEACKEFGQLFYKRT